MNRVVVGALVVLASAVARLTDVPRDARLRSDRGDVPGWVMVTVMSAALVAALLVPFRTAIVAAVQAALANVTGLGGQ